MIIKVILASILIIAVAFVVICTQRGQKKPKKSIMIISSIVIIVAFIVSIASEVYLQSILENSVVIERDGQYVRVSPFYSEEFLRNRCGEEYYIVENGIDSMFAQLVSKVIKTSPYNH